MTRSILMPLVTAMLLAPSVLSWQTVLPSLQSHHSQRCLPKTSALHLFGNDNKDTTVLEKPEDEVETTTEKYGLEAGLFQSFRQGDGGESAKSLLKKYGIAYLATSIPLAIVSFTICYFLVDAGIDVAALLSKVGIESAATEKAGTFAIAYAAHKAASPIRFPPTVLLTPVVAKMIGKEPEEVNDDEDETLQQP